jgi:predicted RNA-binding Zn-ribbon protein involved in translation (DUF1610 family)
MDATCPVDKRHKTTDALFCSVCGARILPVATRTNIICPDCQTERLDLFIEHCEVCRYNFNTKAYNRFKTTIDLRSRNSGAQKSLDAASLVGGLVNSDSDEGKGAGAKAKNQIWQIKVAVDSSLYVYPDPQVPCPNEPEKVLHIQAPETLVGRKSESRRVFPDVCLNDPGASHRHVKLLKDQEENLHLLDVGSANGTSLNGSPVEAGMKKLLRDGDQITLGCWTRITIQLSATE